MNITNRLIRLTVKEEGFAFDPDCGASFRLNHTGIQMVKALSSGPMRLSWRWGSGSVPALAFPR